MGAQILIILIGFFRWILKGCKTKLNEEIYGQKNNPKSGSNYLIGLIILILIIVLLMIF
jgi:hypothetical protein